MAKLSENFEENYKSARSNLWYYLFYLFCRGSLAFAFMVAGMVKIMGERFASELSPLHPLGAYLEALHHTGYYYTFIGVVQVIAAFLLIVPRTVLIGALLYLPIILNIWILSFALGFEGSYVTALLMVMANIFILVWHADKLRYLMASEYISQPIRGSLKYSRRFPFKFFLFVLLFVVGTIIFDLFGYEVMPRNTLQDCQKQFEGTEKEGIGLAFCLCIHEDGIPLEEFLKALEGMSSKSE
jgi:hypothetical protein